MRKKIIIITVCLLVAALLTALITRGANQKYNEVSKSVEVYVAAEFIPVGAKVQPGMLKTIGVPEVTANKFKMITDEQQIVGKNLVSHALTGNPIYKNQVSDTFTENRVGYKKVGLAVTQPSSDQAVAGDRVDIYPVFSNENNQLVIPTEPLVSDAYVLASYDQNGRIIAPTEGNEAGLGSTQARTRVPSMVEVEVADDKVAAVVGHAAKKQIYLVRR